MVEAMYKHTHVHIQFGQCVADFFLLISWPVHHAIVLDGAKPCIISKFYLVDKIISRAVFEHAIMNSIIEIKWLFGKLPARFLFILYRTGAGACNCSTREQCSTSGCETMLQEISSLHRKNV